mmetsp:Transcript_34822/g.81306  ORF Transcript_34822/g.81306 Transcript_34822/m.81306 type:complete len:515 (-) Transcript_34822:102-1646(-)
MAEAKSLGSLEDENDLWHFLKVAKSDWTRHDVARVLMKLKAIGVSDVGELLRRVNRNSINDELESCGWGRFSRETIESIRKRGPFVRSLQACHEPSVRQIGVFAPVPSLFSSKRLAASVSKHSQHGSNAKQTAKDAGEKPDVNYAAQSAPDLFPTAARRRSEKGIQEHLDRTKVHGSTSLQGLLPKTVTSTRFREDDSTIGTSRSRGAGSRLRYRQERGRPQSSSQLGRSAPSLPDIHFSNTTEGFGMWHHGHDRGQPGSSSSSNEAHSLGRLQDDVHLPAAHDEAPSHPARTAAHHGDVSLEEMERMQAAGSTMRTQPLEARWLTGHRRGPLQQGEDMLEEQEALAEKGRLVRELDATSRSHLVRNIRARLKAEEAYSGDSANFLNIEHRCTNIRKNLSAMVNARRELAGLRGRLLEPEDDREHSFLKGCDAFKKLKIPGREENAEDDHERRHASRQEAHHGTGSHVLPHSGQQRSGSPLPPSGVRRTSKQSALRSPAAQRSGGSKKKVHLGV